MSGPLRGLAASLRTELRVYRLVIAHERTPWMARVLIGAAVAYAVSPLDLIPDWIPLVGQLDDVIVVPALLALGLRLIPNDVVEECRRVASSSPQGA